VSGSLTAPSLGGSIGAGHGASAAEGGAAAAAADGGAWLAAGGGAPAPPTDSAGAAAWAAWRAQATLVAVAAAGAAAAAKEDGAGARSGVCELAPAYARVRLASLPCGEWRLRFGVGGANDADGAAAGGSEGSGVDEALAELLGVREGGEGGEGGSACGYASSSRSLAVNAGALDASRCHASGTLDLA
jgi:hypothetical protein